MTDIMKNPTAIRLCTRHSQTEFLVKANIEMLNAAVVGGAQKDIDTARATCMAAFEQQLDAKIAVMRFAVDFERGGK